MKFLIVKITNNNNIEYGKTFDCEVDAIRAAAEMNKIAAENDCSDIQFAVLPEVAE